MANLAAEKLTTEEVLMLREMFANPALLSALRKIFGSCERDRLEAMRSEALGQSRPHEIVKEAATSRAFAEWENSVQRGMERLKPQIR